MRFLPIIFFGSLGIAMVSAAILSVDRAGIIDIPSPIRFLHEQQQEVSLPEAQTYTPQTAFPAAGKQEDDAAQTIPRDTLPIEINLSVPFTSQAPHQNWEMPWQEYCEEASVLMAGHYFLGKNIPNANYADQELHRIQAFEEERLGYYKDTTAEETAMVLREFYGVANVVVEEASIERMRQAVAQGKLVLVPAAGRQLGNPYFTQPGPLYHMLVIKGYTKDGRFITNDPGTRRGENYLYNPEVILNAAHDWNDGDVEHGAKVMIVAG